MRIVKRFNTLKYRFFIIALLFSAFTLIAESCASKKSGGGGTSRSKRSNIRNNVMVKPKKFG